eukprot:TRINITY_DN5568_c0_g2_i1.p1 TRINITY_DN5568_c0_g2~~TRINITY_DN5568_c0_g2_i1.p1  ORF type:complete len:415 (+),score=70.45 TRINITY_DN5568_c0_g2_i1:278-1522(+)
MQLQQGIPSVCEVKYISPQKGRGLFLATPRNIVKGEVIYTERPFVAVQHVRNRSEAWTCGYCFRFLGNLNDQTNKLCQHLKLPHPKNLPPHPKFNFAPTQVFECFSMCGECYCSEACRTQAWNLHHQFLCVGQITSASHPLFRFKTHSIESNELFLLAAQVLACMISRHIASNGKESLLEIRTLLLNSFVHRPIWEVLGPECGLTLDELKNMVIQSLELLQQTFQAIFPNTVYFQDLLNPDFYSILLGMLELNDNAIGFDSPLEFYLREIEPISPAEKKQAEEILTPIIQKLEDIQNEDDEEWEDVDDNEELGDEGEDEDEEIETPDKVIPRIPNFEGFGSFPTTAMMNHSCVPNCIVNFNGDFNAVITALRDIQPGEELLHSYIEESDPIKRRREELKVYGFVCDCIKCSSGS